MKSRALTALLATSLILGAAPAAHAQQAKEPLPLPQVFVDNNKGDTTNLDQTELLESVNGRRIAAKDSSSLKKGSLYHSWCRLPFGLRVPYLKK